MTEIRVDGDGDGRFYIFTDIADLFWPGDYSYSNHDAQARVVARIEQERWRPGTKRAAWGGRYRGYNPPGRRGLVGFDSESGCFECHAGTREAVEAVRDLIYTMLEEREQAREALR